MPRLTAWDRNAEAPKFRMPGWGLWEEFLSDLPSRVAQAETWRPSVDILENEGNLILRVDVPGIDQKEINLKLEGNILTLQGERKMDEAERNQYHRVESFFGSFSRSFTLPDSVDRDNIKADYKNGVLTVTIPQKPEVKARAIPVRTS
jgi:HSP20 family protein